jgi:hypothetical protein
VAGSCEHSNEPPGSIKRSEILECFSTMTQLHGVGQLVKELTTTVHSITHMWLVQLWLICAPFMSIYNPVEFAWRFCPTIYIHERTRELLDRFFMKSDTGKFYEQLLNHFTFNFQWTILTTILHEDQCVFLFIFRSVTH